MKYMECPYCKEIALPVEGGDCEECGRTSLFNLDDDSQPKDDCSKTPRQVVAVIRPKGHWFTKYSQSTGGRI